MAKPAWACFLSAIVLTFICGGIYAFIERADVAKATLSEVAAIVGVDTNTTGNDATHVGTIDRCVAIKSSGTFYIDLFVKGVTDLNSWDGTLSFDENVVAVNSLDVANKFLGSNNYPFLTCYPGSCTVSNLDTTHAGHTGSGVLGRLALTPIAVGATTKTSKLYFTFWKPPSGVSGVTLLDSSGADIGDLDGDHYFDGLVFNAIVVVGTTATCPTDADLDGFTNVEESVDGSDLLNASSTPEMCDVDGVGNGIDNDLDGLANEWYDRDPVNGIPDCTDADSDSDGVHPHNPTDTDDDNDGYTDAREAYLGTDSLDSCAVNSYHSAWPLDINNDKTITVAGDVLNYRGLISTAPGDGKFRKRLDLNADQVITVAGDVLKFRGLISTSCS